jgi:uncharacterized phage protein (TIGR01671 family)
MREIKFRAWDKKNKRWVSKDYEEEAFEIYLDGKFLGLAGEIDRDWNDDYILMQYTGLKDKNGKEIYEEDIVKIIEHNYHCGGYSIVKGIVRWSDKRCGFFVYPISEGFKKYYRMSDVDKAIGNIYENPELIKESER